MAGSGAQSLTGADGKIYGAIPVPQREVPARFVESWTYEQGRKIEKYKEVPAEIKDGQWANEAASTKVSFELAPLGKDDLVVHEWGVFTVFNDAKYANVDRKAEWGSLPSFFYRQFPKERLCWVPSAWDKPIIYFYAKPTPMSVEVNVKFSEGCRWYGGRPQQAR